MLRRSVTIQSVEDQLFGWMEESAAGWIGPMEPTASIQNTSRSSSFDENDFFLLWNALPGENSSNDVFNGGI